MSEAWLVVTAALLGILIGTLAAYLTQSKRDRSARRDETCRALYIQFLAAAQDAYGYAGTVRNDPARQYSEPALQLARIMYDISEENSRLETALDALSLVTSTNTQKAAQNVGEAIAKVAEGRSGPEPKAIWDDVLGVRAARRGLRTSMQRELGLR